MKHTPRSVARFGTAVLTGALMISLAAGAQAQPGGGGGGGGQFGNMTPEQRQQMRAQMEAQRAANRENWQKQALTAAGLTDAAAQTAVIDYGKAQDTAKATLQEKARALSTLITTAGTPDATITTELAAFRAAVAEYKKQQAAGLADLDAKTKYSTTPRIDAVLTLLGIIGDETTELGGLGAVFPDSPYGAAGGFGRGQGGRGGQGGQGGGRGQGAGGQGGFGGQAAGGQGGRRGGRNRGNNQAQTPEL